MKRKEILARAITLGLLLAMPVGGVMAADLTIDSSHTENLGAEWNPVDEGYYIYHTRSLNNNTITIDGVEVRGNAWKVFEGTWVEEGLPDDYWGGWEYVDSGKTSDGANIYGGYARKDNDQAVSNNQVVMNSGSTISDNVASDFEKVYYPEDGYYEQIPQTNFDTGSLIGGQSDGDGNVTNNSVNIKDSTMANSAIGGYSNGNGAISGNAVVIENSTVKNVYGGYAHASGTNGDVIENSVNITGGKVEKGNIIGGESQNGVASGNRVVINGTTITGNNSNFIYGGNSAYGAADNNTVSISNVKDLDVAASGAIGIVGGINRMGDEGASNNKVTLENVLFGSTSNPTRKGFAVIGGSNSNGFAYGNEVEATNVQNVGLTGGYGITASTNIVTVKGESSISYVTGGDGYAGGKGQANAINNIVNIEGGVIGDIRAGYVNTGVAQSNEVHVSGGTVNGDIYGGTNINTGSATDNVIEISGGTINSSQIIGGRVGSSSADNPAEVTGNKITISGGDFNTVTDVIGGVANGADAQKISNNTITVKKTDSDFDLSKVSLYGAKSTNTNAQLANNALVIDGWRGTVNTIGGVTDLQFEHVDLSAGGVLSAVKDTDLTGVKIAVNSLKEGSDLAAGDKEYTIIDGATSKITIDNAPASTIENIDTSGNGVRVHDVNTMASDNNLVANITKSVLANVYVAEDGQAMAKDLVIGEGFKTNASVVAGAYTGDVYVYAGYSESGKGEVGANTITLQEGADVGALYGSNTATAAGSLVVEAGNSKAASINNFAGAALAEGSELTTGTVAVNTLTNEGTLTAKGDVTAKETLTNSGTLKAESNTISAEKLTNAGTLTAKDVSAESLEAQSGTLTATNTLAVTNAVNVGKNASVEAEQSGLSANAITNDGTLTIAGAVVASGTLSNSGMLNTNGNNVSANTLTNSGTLTGADIIATKGLENSGTLIGASVEAATLVNEKDITASGSVTAKGTLDNKGMLSANGDVTATETLTNSGTLTGADIIATKGLENTGTLIGASVEADQLNNSGTLNAKAVTATNGLTNNGTLEAEGDISAKTLTSGDNSKLTAHNVITTGNISVGNGATITVNDVTSSTGALSIGTGSNITANAVDVEAGVTLGNATEANITKVNAESLSVGAEGKLTSDSVTLNGAADFGKDATVKIANSGLSASVIINDGTLTTAGAVVASGALSNSGTLNTNGNNVSADTLTNSGTLTGADIIATKGLENTGILTGASVEAATLVNEKDIIASGSVTAKGTLENKGTLNAKGDITATETLTNSGTLTGADIIATKGLENTGTLIGASIEADQLTNNGTLTGANVEAETLVNNSVITASNNVTATTLTNNKEIRAIGNIKANGELINNGTLTGVDVDATTITNSSEIIAAGDVTATNGLTNNGTLKAQDVETATLVNEKEITATGNVAAKYTLINSGTLTGASADAAALTNRGTLNITGNVKTDVLANSGTADVGVLTVNDQGVINANGGSLQAGTITANQAIINANGGSVQADTITANNSTIATNGGTLTANTIVADNLTINALTNTEKQVFAKELDGDKLTVRVSGLTDNQVVIGNYTGESVSVIGGSDITDSFGNDMPGIEAGMQDLAATVDIGAVDKELVAEEGSVLGTIKGKVENGILTVTGEKVNTFNQGISEMASIALMTWRQENNDMNKRLGELRDSSGEHGVWVRMTRGESKYGAQNIKNQYNAYQLGYDEKLSSDKRWTVGAALTYTDANSSFSGGKGENKHKGLAIYGSRLNDDGSFIDLIARYARLEHDFDVRGGAGKGDFDTNGYSLSAEYGKRFTQKSGLWIEPQVELTYGRVGSADYITDKGVRVRQEGMDSLVGRLGFALGQNLAKGKGNVYLRASYLYDFDGETDVRFANSTQNRGFKQDLGGGWWEVGVGTNVNLSEAMHLYFDVEKTYGGNVATPWQWNAGLRWSF